MRQLQAAAAIVVLLACQSAAHAGPQSPSAAALWSSFMRTMVVVLNGLHQDPSTWSAVSRLVVGGVSGLLVFVLVPVLRIGGVLGCILVGIMGSALAGWLVGHIGITAPDGISPLAIGIGFVACVTILAGAKVAHRM